MKRKVLLCGSFWNGSLEESYARAFESIGWNVVRFDWDQYAAAHPLSKLAPFDKLLRSKIADRVGKIFVAAIEETSPDFSFVFKGRRISAAILSDAKQKMGDRSIVNFNPDSPWDASNRSPQILESIPIYDIHFTWNKGLLEPFQSLGAKKVEYLPFAYDPELHRPIEIVAEPEFDAIFIGTYSPERDRLLGNVKDLNVRIAGNGWGKATHVPKEWILSEARYGEDSVQLIRMGACSINILREQNRGSHNMRTFEIPATRSAMLTTRSEEQAQWFEEGRDIECYSSPEELREKIKMLAVDRIHTQEIAQNGYEKVREETYAKRAGTIVSVLGLGR